MLTKHSSHFIYGKLGYQTVVLLVVISLIMISSWSGVSAATNVLYAKPEASGSGDCSTWEEACSLQTALSNAMPPDQIWVMEGRYIPTTTGERSISFTLNDGIAIYGGFNGTETSLDQRDWVTNITLLSGDLNGDDNGFENNSENSYHVVQGVLGPLGSILDGVMISGGNASGSYSYGYGGGWGYSFAKNDHGLDVQNKSYIDAGGERINSFTGPTVENVIFSGNMAQMGGGMYYYSSTAKFINVTFDGNLAHITGGGMVLTGAGSTFTNVTFNSNHAGGGGAIAIDSADPLLTNVTFTDNSVQYYGGAVNVYSVGATLVNATFYGNVAYGGGSAIYNQGTSTIVVNSILWGDMGDEIRTESGSTTTVSYSDVQGGYEGTGNIDIDPVLAPLDDYGGWVNTMAVLPGSPVIDMATNNCPATDARGLTRSAPQCDMGAYESHGFSLSVNYGDNQSAPINAIFPLPVCIGVQANQAEDFVDGGLISLTAPLEGPSAIFEYNPAIIDEGEACTFIRANPLIGGPYEVTAYARGTDTTSFHLTNINPFRVYLSNLRR